jgi:hypothetical protein
LRRFLKQFPYQTRNSPAHVRLVLLTKAEKQTSPVFVLNVLSLTFDIIRNVLRYFCSPHSFIETYAYHSPQQKSQQYLHREKHGGCSTLSRNTEYLGAANGRQLREQTEARRLFAWSTDFDGGTTSHIYDFPAISQDIFVHGRPVPR